MVYVEDIAMTGLPITATTASDQNWVLNPTLCRIKTVEGKGRSVFGTRRSFGFTLV